MENRQPPGSSPTAADPGLVTDSSQSIAARRCQIPKPSRRSVTGKLQESTGATSDEGQRAGDPGDAWLVGFEARYQGESQKRRRRRRTSRRPPTREQIERQAELLDSARTHVEGRFELAKTERQAHEQRRQEEADRRRAEENEYREREGKPALKPDRHVAAPELTFWRYVEAMRHTDPDAKRVYQAETEPEYRDISAAKVSQRKATEKARLRDGFVWQGGCVGGNAAYYAPPFIRRDLLCEGDPVLKLFVTKLPRGPQMTCGDAKDDSYPAPLGSKLLGCDAAYVDGRKDMRGFLRVDLDRQLTWAEVEAACGEAGVPLPNIAVGWSDAEGKVHNPHLIWLLRDSVGFGERHKKRFKMRFEGVLHGLTAALLRQGADAGAVSNCMRVKNPLSPLWSHRVIAQQPYSLDQLSQHVDTRAELPGVVRAELAERDEPEEVAGGSNSLFRRLSRWARDHVRAARDEQGWDFEQWLDRVKQEAREIAGQLTPPERLDSTRKRNAVFRRTDATAKSVADWTWRNVGAASHPRPRLSRAQARARQADAGRRTAKDRREWTFGRILAVARELAALGLPLTTAAVHDALRGECNRRTVQRYWPRVLALHASAATNGLSVKKDCDRQPRDPVTTFVSGTTMDCDLEPLSQGL